MATGTLTSTTIAATYKSLLKVKGGANQVLEAGSTAHYLEDGDGNDSVLALSQAFVGIGSEAPLALLSVGAIATLVTDGTTAVTPEGMNLHITEASKYAMGIKNADVSGDGLIIQAGDASDDYALRVENYDSGNDLFVITGGGFVGLGTASPSQQFNIVSGSADKPQILFENTRDDNTCAIMIFDNTKNTTGDGDDGDELGKIFFKGRNDRNGGQDPEQISYSLIQSKIVDASDGTEDGELEFYTMSNGTSAVRLEIVSDDVTVSTGNLVIGTAGKGIDFSNQASPAAGMSSELLDRYEEGTFSPTLVDDAGSLTQNYHGDRAGFYTRIGRFVFCNGRIKMDSSGITAGGSGSIVRLAALPFASADVSNNLGTVTIGYASGWGTANGAPTHGYVSPNASTADLHVQDNDAGNVGSLANTNGEDVEENTQIFFSASYYTA